MACISDKLIQLLPRAARNGAGIKRDFESKDRGEMKMKKIKTKSLRPSHSF